MGELEATEKKIFGWGKYEFTILWWSFLIWGLVFLDRLVMPFTAPAVIADLGITEVQYGLINAFTTGAYAIGAIFITGALERTGKRKKWLILDACVVEHCHEELADMDHVMVPFDRCRVVAEIGAQSVPPFQTLHETVTPEYVLVNRKEIRRQEPRYAKDLL